MDSIFSNRMIQIILGYIPINSDEKIKERIKLFYSFEIRFMGDGEIVTDQFPLAGEEVHQDSVVILYLE